MSEEAPQLSRRDKIEAELDGCVENHEKIRELLRGIDAAAPGLIPLTREIRNFILDLGQCYHRLRNEIAVSAMLKEFQAPSADKGQRPVNELPMFVGLKPAIDESAETRKRFAAELARCGDDTLRDDLSDGDDRIDGEDDEQNVLFEEEVPRA